MMGYFNYHRQALKLIREGHLTSAEIFEHWNNIAPALVLFFDNHRPIPIREYNQNTGERNWDKYWSLINRSALEGD